jgi:pimeloyl-ACP methyl ester carboxylesterase
MQELVPGIHAQVSGHGPHVLMLHGVNVTHRSWGESLPQHFIDANYTLVMPDLPGYGMSPAYPDGNLAEQTAHALIRWLEKVPKPVHIIGHSYGGGVGIIIARERSDLVDKMVLIAPGGCYPSPRSRGRLENLDEYIARFSGNAFVHTARAVSKRDWGRKLIAWAALRRSKDSASYWNSEWDPTHTARAITGLVQYNVDQAATELAVPTYLLWGDSDRIIFPTFMRRLAERTAWPHAHYERAGHMLHLDEPDAVASLIIPWLES